MSALRASASATWPVVTQNTTGTTMPFLFYLLFAALYILPCCAAIKVEELSLEQKVGQLLMVHFNGEEANADAAFLIQEVGVGGIIYYNWANGLNSPAQVKQLSHGLQELAKASATKLPLLIATDQEGGRVSRLTTGFTCFPSNGILGATEEPFLAEENALTMGKELCEVGINLNLAPVVDIYDNPHNPVIGERAYGATPQIVIDYAGHAIKGFHQAGISTCIKHFPGHGSVAIDSHAELPVLNKSRAMLEQCELLPFAALAGQTDAIMTAHILVPAIDTDNCATLSKSLLDILRNDYKFNGVIISDSLVMQGLLNNCHSIDEACIRAFNAGCDILLLGGKQLTGSNLNLELTAADVQRIHNALVSTVKAGHISQDRLDTSVKAILTLKRQVNVARHSDAEY